jgi:heparan-alpha-glucosaminide N-acetyltransferase
MQASVSISTMPAAIAPAAAPTSIKTERIASIDVYRGMVMFLMLAEVLKLDKVKSLAQGDGWVAATLQWISFHTSHVEWRGCSLHDMIQPSFTFLVGTAMAFSIASRKNRGSSWGRMCLHAIWRSLILVFLGIFLRSLDKPTTNFTFDDTLTQIGLGYWILFLLSSLSIRKLIIAMAVILTGYWLAFVLYPSPGSDFAYASVGVPEKWAEHYRGIGSHFNKNSNLAWAFDRWWMNLFPREKPFEFAYGGYSTLSFVPTLGTMILGLLAGRILQFPTSAQHRQSWLWSAAAICLVLAVVIDYFGLCPIVKRIWTPSWTLWSGGLCMIWLAILNVICDLFGYRAWGWVFLVIGSNSIVAYCMSWTLEQPIEAAIERHFGPMTHRLVQNLSNLFYEAPTEAIEKQLHGVLIGTVVLLVFWLVLLWLYRRRVFVRI